MILDAQQCCLLVIDIQSKLNPVMFDPVQAPEGAAKLLQAAGLLEVPTLVCEQYPKGIGATVEGLQQYIPTGCLFEKSTFSALADQSYRERFESLHKPQVVVCGIETHVCVLQSALDLLAKGASVFVVADATASRTKENHDAGLDRIRAEGGRIVTLEMVLFEWLKRSDSPHFKQISQLIK